METEIDLTQFARKIRVKPLTLRVGNTKITLKPCDKVKIKTARREFKLKYEVNIAWYYGDALPTASVWVELWWPHYDNVASKKVEIAPNSNITEIGLDPEDVKEREERLNELIETANVELDTEGDC